MFVDTSFEMLLAPNESRTEQYWKKYPTFLRCRRINFFYRYPNEANKFRWMQYYLLSYKNNVSVILIVWSKIIYLQYLRHFPSASHNRVTRRELPDLRDLTTRSVLRWDFWSITKRHYLKWGSFIPFVLPTAIKFQSCFDAV